VPFWTNNFNSAAVGRYGLGAVFDGWTVISNQVNVFPDYSVPWLQNNFLILGQGVVSNSLPTTNLTQYQLTFRATHAPYLVGMVTWWPFEGDASDIFGGLNGLLYGDVTFTNGEVGQAYYGDGIASRVIVPASPNLNLEGAFGLSVEGWIHPANVTNLGPLVEWYDPTPGVLSPLGVQFWLGNLSSNNLSPGTLSAALWDTSSQPHYVATGPQALTNGGWQHVALTYDASALLASLYTNGHLAATQTLPAGTVVRTTGDVYLGFDPTYVGFGPNVPTFVYSNFSSVAGLKLLGNAAPANGVLRLTPAEPEMNGAAWYTERLLCSGGFSTTFDFQITDANSEPGSPQDFPRGFSFLVQNQGLGYQPTWWANSQQSQWGWGVDTNAITVAFMVNSDGQGVDDSVDVRAYYSPPFENNLLAWTVERGLSSIKLGDGAVHQAEISFDGLTLTVILDNQPVITNFTMPFSQCRAFDTNGFSYVGFSAGTSLVWENHDILNWTFNAREGIAYAGGLDEFSLYSRALSAQEVQAIYNTGANGKYGTNALTCPVALKVALATGAGGATTNYTFTNGLSWGTNGLSWETNTIDFTTVLQSAPTNGPAANFTPITLIPLDPNVTVDDFVLSALTTNYLNGLMYFTDNTNLAATPIKFAPAPYVLSNNPPTLVFSNGFPLSTAAVYATGSTIAGATNGPAIGINDWTVVQGPVTVVSNALVDAMSTNFLVLGTGTIQTTLPTVPGNRYQLSYTFRGPGAVSWWNGAVNPLDGRLQDLLGGNDGALINGAASVPAPESFVGNQGIFLPGMITNGVDGTPFFGSNIQLGDPENLRFTNSFTIECWINPLDQTNKYVDSLDYVNPLPSTEPLGGTFTEQIFFRGDSRECTSPYYLALERGTPAGVKPERYDLVFHIGSGPNDCFPYLYSLNNQITTSNWWHIAAVFESNFPWTNNPPWPTNLYSIYINGTNWGAGNPDIYLVPAPFRDLDPAYSPGVAIGNAGRADQSQAFRGFIDELTVYGRALTAQEILEIYAAGTNGTADLTAPPAQSLAKLAVSLDGLQMDVENGDNGQWDTYSFLFTASHTNAVLALQGLLPGTLLDGVTLTEIPSQLNYQPENSLAPLLGTDAFGAWTLEMQDTDYGAGSSSNLAQLVTWQLNFQLFPSNPPPIIELSHGIPYTNTLVGFSVQNFLVQVPLWATNATNVLLSAADLGGNPQPMGLLYDTNTFPTTTANALVWPPAEAPQSVTLSTNAASKPVLMLGKPYFLTVTNPNATAVQFAIGVWFDILSLTNCQTITNAVVGPAGIPTYFQFDVPANGASAGLPQDVAFWLGNATTNVTVVLSQHLPLPDLGQYDYISRQPGPNAEIVMVVEDAVPSLGASVIGTNSTPWPIQTGRWYAGVFNAAQTNISFAVQACYSANYPAIIPLTNGVPYVAAFTSRYASPPGAPRTAFFGFQITNAVEGVLFQLYNLSGNADLVLQRDVPPTMAPYFAGSFQPGLTPEQIVVRTSAALPDLRGNWYLGVYNNELTNNVAYTIRAILPAGGMLVSALPTVVTNSGYASSSILLSWYSIVGEWYSVSFTDGVSITNAITNVLATTPVTTWVVPTPKYGGYFVTQEPAPAQTRPSLTIQLWTNNSVRISWPTNFTGFTLQYSLTLTPPVWVNLSPPAPIGVEGAEYVVYDAVTTKPKYYRLSQ
jgi:hypothetical protein